MTSQLRPLEFPHLGITLQIQRIPQMLVQDWRRSLPPEPEVPKQEVAFAGGVKRMEENPSHPEYVQAMQDHLFKVGMLAIDFAIERGVVIDIDQAAVDELRQWAGSRNIFLPASDKVLYVSRILISDLADLVTLRTAVFGRFEPTQEQIDQAVERFPSTVQGS